MKTKYPLPGEVWVWLTYRASFRILKLEGIVSSFNNGQRFNYVYYFNIEHPGSIGCIGYSDFLSELKLKSS